LPQSIKIKTKLAAINKQLVLHRTNTVFIAAENYNSSGTPVAEDDLNRHFAALYTKIKKVYNSRLMRINIK
jgi:hypothetical protein